MDGRYSIVQNPEPAQQDARPGCGCWRSWYFPLMVLSCFIGFQLGCGKAGAAYRKDKQADSQKSEQDEPSYYSGEQSDARSKQKPVYRSRKISDLNPPDKSPLANRQSSLHPEHDPYSSGYSGRSADGPEHGPNPHGPDPHDEQHVSGPGYPSSDPYNGSTSNNTEHPYRPY